MTVQNNPKEPAERTVTLIDNATKKQVELPVLDSKCGPSVIDIRSLYRELGYFTYDPGFTATACGSRKFMQPWAGSNDGAREQPGSR